MPKGVPYKQYSGEFKQKVIETMHAEHLSFHEVERRFDIPSHKIVHKWERIYLEEGPDGLHVERRGKGSTGRPPALGKRVEEDLIAENQRLRAEVDYLKNLHALVSEREQHQQIKRG